MNGHPLHEGWIVYLRNLLFGLLLFNLFPCTFFYKREKRRNFREGEKKRQCVNQIPSQFEGDITKFDFSLHLLCIRGMAQSTFREWSLITGRRGEGGGGLQNCRGQGGSEVLPLQKKGGGGRKSFSHVEGEAQNVLR